MGPRSYKQKKARKSFRKKDRPVPFQISYSCQKGERCLSLSNSRVRVRWRKRLGSSIALPPWPIYYQVSFLSTSFLLLTPWLHGQLSVLGSAGHRVFSYSRSNTGEFAVRFDSMIPFHSSTKPYPLNFELARRLRLTPDSAAWIASFR